MSIEKIEQALRDGLEGVTPGEWEAGSGWVFVDTKDGYRTSPLRHILRDVPAYEIQANCDYIAAARPENIRALLDELSRLREALQDIAASDDIDNALDPARNKRVAARALSEREEGQADG